MKAIVFNEVSKLFENEPVELEQIVQTATEVEFYFDILYINNFIIGNFKCNPENFDGTWIDTYKILKNKGYVS